MFWLLTNERPRCEPGDTIRADLTRRHRQEQTERRRPAQGIVSCRAFSTTAIITIADRSAGRQAGRHTHSEAETRSIVRKKKKSSGNKMLCWLSITEVSK